MHPLRLLLYTSLLLGAVVAWGLAAALLGAGLSMSAAVLAALGSLVAFLIPWTGVWMWAVRRASDLEELSDRTRKLAEGTMELAVRNREFHGEVDDLARSIEEVRTGNVRLRGVLEMHRAAMDEIVNSLGEGLVAVTPKGRVAFANRRVAEMFGGTGVLVGRSVLEVVRKQSVVAALERALAGEMTTAHVTYGSGDAERQIEVRAFPATASPEIAAVALFIDVTRIERLQRVRKDFLDDFSHEVRTPLTGLKSAAETLEQGGLARDDEVQLRHVMQRQIGRIERLVTDLADLNQIESGQLVLNRQPVSLREFVSDAAGDYGAVVHGDATAVIDAERAQQIFVNLLDNARKHGGADGGIDVDIATENGHAVVRVSDQGPGIPPHELERIFHRFYRVDRSRSQPGTGLGLAIAKHLTVAHGGTIRAFNRPGGGATFEVRLPAALA